MKSLKLGARNEELILNGVVEYLVDPLSENSWTLVVPPGFGESYVPWSISDRLRSHPNQPRVALVKADEVRQKEDLLRQLWRQWGEGEATSATELNWSNADLADVLSAIDSSRKRILVISRFHRILDWVDETILTALRNAEEASTMQTVVVSMYPLDWIKREWRDTGRDLAGSDYGLEHSIRETQPLTPEDCFRLYQVFEDKPVPPELIRMAIGWTGGYPEYMRSVFEEWVAHNRPDWTTRECQRQLFKKATNVARRMSEAIDHGNANNYRSLMVDLHLQTDDSVAYERLQRAHPWREILLDDCGIRSDGVGEACLNLETEDFIRTGNSSAPIETWYASCLSLYRRRQYEQVIQIIGEKSKPNDTPAVQLLRNAARIMDAIYARGVDMDWRTVSNAIREEKEWLKSAPISTRDNERILNRLGEIEELATSMSKVSGSDSRRVVDVWAGLRGSADIVDHKMAMTLLLLQFESARATRGNSEAIQKCLSMAEQVLRVWTWWHLGLNYYETPSDCESTWNLASVAWKTARGIELTISRPGAPFPGIVAFAYFAVATLLDRGALPTVAVPAASFAELEKQLFVFEWRNDAAHSLAIFDAKNRRKFFDVLDRWLECLCASVPQGPTSRTDLLSVIEPLPTFQDGRLDWRS